MANWWIGRQIDGGDAGTGRPAVPFDYALTDFDAVVFDETGRQTLRVAGPRLEHDPKTRTALLVDPRFVVPGEPADWRGRAERGRLARADEELQLEGAVVLTRPDPRGEIRIETERLDYDRRTGRLTAPETVRFTQAGSELVGGTLVYLLNDDRLELQNDVHATYRDAGTAAAAGARRGDGNDDSPGPGRR
nr:LPS export ABC transporter periplasmic protein LptC [Wenzhouxiangella sp. XN79A]